MKNLWTNAQKHGKISKNLTTFMHFEIQNFGKVLKISGRIMEKFLLFMEIYTPGNNRKDSSIFRQLVAPSNFKRFNMKVSFGTLQKKTTTVGNFCNMFFCNTLLIKTFALYRPSIGKEWNGSKYISKLRSGKIHTLTYIMYNIGATFF